MSPLPLAPQPAPTLPSASLAPPPRCRSGTCLCTARMPRWALRTALPSSATSWATFWRGWCSARSMCWSSSSRWTQRTSRCALARHGTGLPCSSLLALRGHQSADALVCCLHPLACRPQQGPRSCSCCPTQAALCRIPRRRLTPAEAAEGAGPLRIGACAICLCEWSKGDDVRELSACSHVFHVKCADTWLWRHQKCPMCRTPLAGEGGGAGHLHWR